MTGWVVLIFALIVFLGGIVGYVNAGSVASLVMGVAFATLLSVSAFAIFNGKTLGYYTALLGSSLLAAFFLYRFVSSFKLMPAGLMCLLSVAVLTILLCKRSTLIKSYTK